MASCRVAVVGARLPGIFLSQLNIRYGTNYSVSYCCFAHAHSSGLTFGIAIFCCRFVFSLGACAVHFDLAVGARLGDSWPLALVVWKRRVSQRAHSADSKSGHFYINALCPNNVAVKSRPVKSRPIHRRSSIEIAEIPVLTCSLFCNSSSIFWRSVIRSARVGTRPVGARSNVLELRSHSVTFSAYACQGADATWCI